eukprot:TRINITY_DN1203_c0_g1_i2.p1 TRINITY_DN1203_c0_g1~~TRINITY_DN1203_c0_g1_i2.p1  ORF type:complete len:543 (-),score=99.38 TRINITY_DN1203_c0_g1_i2:1486-3114(-)
MGDVLPALKRAATGAELGSGVSLLVPDDVIRVIASLSDVFTLGALEICSKGMKQALSPQFVWEGAFRRRGWHPIEEVHLEFKRFLQEGKLELPPFRDWRALLVDCARKTRLIQGSFANLKNAVRKRSKKAFKELNNVLRPPATEEQIAEGEKRLFEQSGLLIPWPLKELYRLMNGVEGAHSGWMWDYEIQDFQEEGWASAWENNCDNDPLDQVNTICQAIKEDQALFRTFRAKELEPADSTADTNVKKRKRVDEEDGQHGQSGKNGKSGVDTSVGGGDVVASDQVSESDMSESVSEVSVDEEELLFGDWEPDDDCRPDQLEGTPWDVRNLTKRFLTLGQYDAEYVFIAADLYTGKLVYLPINLGYEPDDPAGVTIWERFDRIAEEIADDGFEWSSIGLGIDSDGEDDGSEQEDNDAAPPPPFTRVESEAGETFSELQQRVGITAPKGGALYRVTKTESVSSTKLLVLYNTSTHEYQTDGVRETLKLSPTAKSVSVKPAMIPSGYELYVSSTSYNRKLAGGPVLLKTGDGNDASENGGDDDDE